MGIGGVGGSGTRVVANILIHQKINLGHNLNWSSDDLTFTRHFKKENWFQTFPTEETLKSAWSSFIEDRSHNDTVDSLWQADISQCVKWGWKEPNTHIFLEFLSGHVPNFKYIHVIRNGLDMAFSQNQQQAKNWGNLLLGDEFDGVITPSISLDYWIAANNRALEVGQRMGKNFLLLKYDELCKKPMREIDRLLSFIGTTGNLNKLTGLITPTSVNRHKNEDLSVFSENQLNQVEKLMSVHP